MSLSGYGCCAFGGVVLLRNCTLSHWYERQVGTIPEAFVGDNIERAEIIFIKYNQYVNK
jgi:hypothetical protein